MERERERDRERERQSHRELEREETANTANIKQFGKNRMKLYADHTYRGYASSILNISQSPTYLFAHPIPHRIDIQGLGVTAAKAHNHALALSNDLEFRNSCQTSIHLLDSVQNSFSVLHVAFFAHGYHAGPALCDQA